MLLSYSDIVAILSYAPHCCDIAANALDTLALQSDAAKLADHAAWSTLVSDLVAIGAA